MKAAVLACVILVSCGDSAQSCLDVRLQAGRLLETLDRSCDSVDDCVLIGASETQSCCGEALFPGGAALSRKGAASDGLKEIQSAFDSCTGGGKVACDAAPAALSCAGHLCTASPRGCPSFVDAGVCVTTAEIPCGDRACAPGELCTLDWPGAASAPPDGGCPSWCMPATPTPGCLCPAARCQALPAGCAACDCAVPDTTCAGPGWQCSCQSAGIVASCYRP